MHISDSFCDFTQLMVETTELGRVRVNFVFNDASMISDVLKDNLKTPEKILANVH